MGVEKNSETNVKNMCFSQHAILSLHDIFFNKWLKKNKEGLDFIALK